MYLGWTQVAFDTDLVDDVVPVDLAGRALVAVRRDGKVRVFDATCPHRGAHLGYGGKPDGAFLVCPFHGHRIHLGPGGPGRFRVREHHAIYAARGLFVLPDPRHDTGLGEYLRGLEATHHIVSAFSLSLRVSPDYVIENVFDADHFAVVHGLDGHPHLQLVPGSDGVLCVKGDLEMARPNRWQVDEPPDQATRTRFFARVFSPTLVAAELGPAAEPNVVITAATPAADGTSVVRVTAAFPRRRSAGPPTVREVASLVNGSRTAFRQDAVIWEHLDTSVVPQYTEGDKLVRAYREFCRRFLAPDPEASR